MSRKSRVFKKVRNIFIAAFIIILILFAIGVAYTWYSGRTTVPIQASNDTTTETPPSQLRRTDISPNAAVSASIQSLESPVAPGQNSSVIVKTNPGAWCTITVLYNKVASKDSGLTGKTSDEYGSVSWSWTVESSVPIGKWPVTVICVRNVKSAVVIGDLEIKQQ